MIVENNITKIKELLLVILLLTVFCIIYLKPILLSPDTYYPFGADTDMLLSQHQIIRTYLLEYKRLPTWNPYYQKGLPILNDPLTLAFSPILTPLSLIFGPIKAYKISILISFILSGILFYLLARRFSIRRMVSILSAITLIVSGDLASRVSAGTLEKVLAYPFLIAYFLTITKSAGSKINVITAAVFLGLMFMSGDNYYPFFAILLTPLYLMLLYAKLPGEGTLFKTAVRAASVTIKISTIFVLIFAFKILPAAQLLPFMKRQITTFYGSQHFPLTLTNFINPFTPHLTLNEKQIRDFLGIQYPWWDYHLFIGSVFLIFLLTSLAYFLFRKDGWRVIGSRISLFIILVLLYQSLQYPYSPFHYLFKFVPPLQMFRNPARINVLLNIFSIIVFSKFLEKTLDGNSATRHKKVHGFIAAIIGVVALASLVSLNTQVGRQVYYNFSHGLFVTFDARTLILYQVWCVVAILASMTYLISTQLWAKGIKFIPVLIFVVMILEAAIVNRNFLFPMPKNFDHPTILDSIKFLKDRDKSTFYVSYPGFSLYDFAEYTSLENNIRILNAYYGYGINDYNDKDLRAKYIFWGSDKDYDKTQYTSIFKNREHQILENPNYTPFAAIIGPSKQSDTSRVTILQDKLDELSLAVKEIGQGDILNVFINYFPGWKYRTDDKNWENVPKGLDLKIPLEKGTRTVDLKFVPEAFYLSSIVSGISVLFLLITWYVKRRIKSTLI